MRSAANGGDVKSGRENGRGNVRESVREKLKGR